MSQSWIITSVVLLIGTAYCSYIGDDDVVYQYLYRRPTPKEGLRRIRWVLLKMFTSIYVGFLLASGIQKILFECCSIRVTERRPIELIAFACIVRRAR
jgi:hypothetical protein